MDVEPSPKTEASVQDQFFRYFQQQITALQDNMNRLKDTSLVGGERKDAADHCLASITRLASEVKDASASLPSYDIRTYSEAIKALQEKFAELQAAFAPKQKFSFKTKKNASAISIQDAAELATQRRGYNANVSSANQSTESSFATTPVHLLTPPNERATTGSTSKLAQTDQHTDSDTSSRQKQDINAQNPSPGISGSPVSMTIAQRSSTYLLQPASTSPTPAPCQITKLSRCCVELSLGTNTDVSFASLTINDVESSLLICGGIAGPAHITGVRDSIILVKCRQFRMHECTNTSIYLHCTSRPIIEDCKGVKFAKLSDFCFDMFTPQSSKATDGSTASKNQWDQVDDFKWLRNNEPSPNWSILPTQDRVPETTWREIIHVPGNAPGFRNINQILDSVGISTSSE